MVETTAAGNITGLPPLELEPPTSANIIAAAFVGILIVLTLFGNGLVCVAFYTFPDLRTICNYFIVSLSMADIIVALLAMPFWFAIQLTRNVWRYSLGLKTFWDFIDILSGTASIVSLTAVSVDRTLAITVPFKYPKLMTPVRACLAIAVVWCYSIAIACSRLAAWPGSSFLHFVATMSFFLPLFVVIVMYIIIFLVVKNQVQSIGKDHVTEMKAAKTIAVVVGCFVICWLPFFVIVLGHAHSKSFSYPFEVFNLLKWMAYFNSALNPVIYTFMNRFFRRAFKRLVTRCYLKQTVGNRRGSTFSSSMQRRGSAISSYFRDRGPRGSVEHTMITLCELRGETEDSQQSVVKPARYNNENTNHTTLKELMVPAERE